MRFMVFYGNFRRGNEVLTIVFRGFNFEKTPRVSILRQAHENRRDPPDSTNAPGGIKTCGYWIFTGHLAQ